MAEIVLIEAVLGDELPEAERFPRHVGQSRAESGDPVAFSGNVREGDLLTGRGIRRRLSKKTGCRRWALKPGRASRDVIAEEAVAFGLVKIL